MVIGPTPPGTGVMAEATCADGIEIHIAGQLAVRQPVHAHVHDHGPRPDHVGLEELRLADGDDHNVGLAGQGGDVAAAAVADGHRGVGAGRLLHQDQGQRFADDVAAADDDDVGAVQGDAVADQQLLHAVRGTGKKARVAGRQQAEIFRAESRPRP